MVQLRQYLRPALESRHASVIIREEDVLPQIAERPMMT
jgi:hypothetical protein